MNAFTVKNLTGIEHVEASDLSDVVVFAGPNGVGKTRLIQGLIDFFRKPRRAEEIRLSIEATSDWEIAAFGARTIDTSVDADASKLQAALRRSQRRNAYKSTVLNFDSDRAITQIQPFSFSWDFPDPFEEDVGWDMSYRFLRDRFQDVQDSLFKLVENQRRKIADRAVRLRDEGKPNMPLDFGDPLSRFKSAFSQLLAPKQLVNVNVKKQIIEYAFGEKTLPIDTLSSGEREVVNIVFDFILRSPSDCIVFFDEPELHLHPELSYKLLQTLSSIGNRNQFIFCTHSPEIITASIENSVIFLTPRKGDGSNQALPVNRDDVTHHALNLLGQSIGIISLGKKLLLIEGDESSLDKQTYGAILQSEFPELVLVPVGGKSTIRSFDEVRESVLNRTIWGVEFFLLCDRDAAYSIGPRSLEVHASERLRVLPRYHLENYFLDPEVLAASFGDMEDEESWLRDSDEIAKRIKILAGQTIPLAVALKVAAAAREEVGNVDLMPRGINSDTTLEELLLSIHGQLSQEKSRMEASLNLEALESLARSEYSKLAESIADGTSVWLRELPGRVVFNRFANTAQIKPGRLKTLYLRKARDWSPDPFDEIRKIFRSFKSLGGGS